MREKTGYILRKKNCILYKIWCKNTKWALKVIFNEEQRYVIREENENKMNRLIDSILIRKYNSREFRIGREANFPYGKERIVVEEWQREYGHVRVDKTFSKDEGEGWTEQQHHLSRGGSRCRERGERKTEAAIWKEEASEVINSRRRGLEERKNRRKWRSFY